MANFIAEVLNTNNTEWTSKYVGNQTFLIDFLIDKTKNTGLVWEANIDNQIVRCVTCDPDLMRKYNLTTDSTKTIKPHKRHKRKY